MDFKEARDGFLDCLSIRGYSPQTIILRRKSLDKFILFSNGHNVNEVKSVTRMLVDEYRHWMIDSGERKFAGGTVALHLTAIKRFFLWLSREKIILFDPAAHLKWKKIKYFPRNIPSAEEMERILSCPDLSTECGLRDRAILEVLYSTGIRRGELINLDIYDVNTKEGVLRIRNGKGGKERMVPLGRAACKFVDRYIKEVRSKPMGNRRRGRNNLESALFLRQGNKRFKQTGICSSIGKYVKAVKPEAKQLFHLFRHAFATHMLQGGADVVTIQRILGHARIGTTGIYTQVKPMDLKETIQRNHPHGRMKNELIR